MQPFRLPETDAIFNPLRRLALFFGLAYIFVRYSMAHEMLTYLVGINLRLVYLTAPVALLGVLMTGGIRRTMSHKGAWCWVGLTIWMILSVPFSSWRGGSIDVVSGFLKAQVGILFVTGGLFMTWKECRLVMYAIAAASILSLFTGHVFIDAGNSGDRLSLVFGSMSNANDYAAHLLLVLPFLMYVAFGTRRNWLTRGVVLGVVAIGLRQMLSTGSRGALVGLAAAAAFAFWRGNFRQRLALAVMIPVGIAVASAVMPDTIIRRLTTFSADDEDADKGAVYSQMSREYLFRRSIEFTLERPMFGVGPGQFKNFEGRRSKEEGQRGNWHSTHNVFTQISSEMGIPALIFFVGALISTFLPLSRVLREARERQRDDIASAVFYILVSLVGYMTAATFLNLGYAYYTPAFTGLAIAFYSAAQREFAIGVGTARTIPPHGAVAGYRTVTKQKTPLRPATQHANTR
jgi:O-antigen ligase